MISGLAEQNWDRGAFDQGLVNFGRCFDVGNLAGFDFVLGDAADLVGLAVDQSVGAALQLAGAAGSNQNLAIV